MRPFYPGNSHHATIGPKRAAHKARPGPAGNAFGLRLGGMLVLLLLVLGSIAPAGGLASGEPALNAEASNSKFQIPNSPTPPSFTLLSSDETGLLIELAVPDLTLETTAEGTAQIQLDIDSGGLPIEVTAPLGARPGDPDLPVIAFLVGIPATGEIHLAVEPLAAAVTLPLPRLQSSRGGLALLPAPQPPSAPEGPGVDYQSPISYSPFPNSQFPISNSKSPASLATLAEVAWLRDQRLARIELAPLQYLPGDPGVLVYYPHLRLRIDFPAQTPRPADLPSEAGELSAAQGTSPFDEVLAASLVNYPVARQFRGSYPNLQVSNAQGNARSGTGSSSGLLGPRYEIVVQQTGLYRLTYADLLAAGLPLDSLDPRQLHMASQGFPVAILITGEEDGRFDPGDELYFYGERFTGERLAEQYASFMLNPGHPANNWLWLCDSTCQLKGVFEKYTVKNVYWLFVADTPVNTNPGTRMARLPAPPAGAPLAPFYLQTVRREEQKIWWSYEWGSEDSWLWDSVQASTSSLPITRSYTAQLSNLATTSYPATVRASITSFNYANGAPDHYTRFSLNTYGVIDDRYWDGQKRYTLSTEVPSSALVPGTNTLFFTNMPSPNPAMSVIYMFFDWFEITYPRQFVAQGGVLDFLAPPAGLRSGLQPRESGTDDAGYTYQVTGFPAGEVILLDISDPLQPSQLVSPTLASGSLAFQANGARFYAAATSALLSSAALAAPITYYTPPDWASGPAPDYVFIAHPDYLAGIQPLANYRAAQGLNTLVINVNDLYRQFNHGIYHPVAIRNFLTWCMEYWGAPPTYALLVGDGHFDFFGYSNTESPATIKMPPNLAYIDPWQGETDATNLLATIIGQDTLPDVLIARLTVANTTQLNNYVNKVLSYEAQSPQAWHKTMTFIADNVPDSAGDFRASANGLISAYVTPRPYFQALRLFQNDYNCPGTGCPAMRTAVNNAFNNGSLLITFIGHGDVNRWAHEEILTTTSIGTLNNPSRLPVVVSLTCKDGWWSRTNRLDIASTLINHLNGGAVATFSPTGLGVGTGHDSLASGFLDAFINKGTWVMGAAALNAKAFLFANGLHQDLMHTFTTFGDPALRIHNPYATGLALVQAAPPGYAGQIVQHTLVVTNTGLDTDRYTLALDTPPTWATTLSAAQTPFLAPGQAYTFTLSVSIPLNALAGNFDQVTVRATSQNNRASAASVLVNTAANSRGIAAPEILEQSGSAGTTLTFSVPVFNTAAQTATLTATLNAGLPWSLVSPAAFTLPVGEGSSVTVTVTIPPGALGGQEFTAGLVFTSNAAPAPLTTTLRARVVTSGLAFASDTLEQAAPAGTPVTYTLYLTNTNISPTSFTLARTYLFWPVSLPAQVGPIAPGDSVAVPLVIYIPDSALGLTALSLDVTATRQDDASAQQTLRLITTALTEGLRLTPASQSLATPATVPGIAWLAVTNRLAFVDSYTIAAVSSEPGWTVLVNEGSPTLSFLGPGSTANFRVLVTPPWYAAEGESTTVTVTLTSGISPAYTQSAEVIAFAIQTRQQIFIPLVYK